MLAGSSGLLAGCRRGQRGRRGRRADDGQGGRSQRACGSCGSHARCQAVGTTLAGQARFPRPPQRSKCPQRLGRPASFSPTSARRSAPKSEPAAAPTVPHCCLFALQQNVSSCAANASMAWSLTGKHCAGRSTARERNQGRRCTLVNIGAGLIERQAHDHAVLTVHTNTTVHALPACLPLPPAAQHSSPPHQLRAAASCVLQCVHLHPAAPPGRAARSQVCDAQRVSLSAVATCVEPAHAP